MVPQGYLIPFDEFLLSCNLSTQIVKPLSVFKHLGSSPLDDKNTSYYTALSLSKQPYSYNELLFISATVICSWISLNKKYKTNLSKLNAQDSSRTSQTTFDKLSVMLHLRTLRDKTQNLEPRKRNPSDTPLTALTQIIDCYERISKLLQSQIEHQTVDFFHEQLLALLLQL